MAVDKFNSVGGFSVGIPPIDIIDSKGNITAPSAEFDNLKANVGNIVDLTSNTATITTGNIEFLNVDTARIDVANIELLNSANIDTRHIRSNSATFNTATIVDRLNVKDVYARNLYGTVHSNVIAGDLQVDAVDTEVIFTKETLSNIGTSVRSATGSPDFTFNRATYDFMGEFATPAKLNLQGEFNVTKVNIGTENTGKVVHEAIAGKTFDNTTQILHNIPSATEVEAVEYTIIATRTFNNIQTERHTCKIVASVLGDDIRYYEYGTAINGGVIGDFEMQFFTASSNSKFIQLEVTPAFSSGFVDYKIFSIIYKG